MVITKQKIYINKLEDLVHTRHSIDSLKNHIKKCFGVDVTIEDITRDDDELTDHNLIFLIDNGDVYVDVDVYFLPMRRSGHDGATIYITEVSYEFQ